MIRSTSAEAYQRIKSDGLINGLKLVIYDALYRHGPLTQREVFDRITSSGHFHKFGAISPRFAELERIGLIFTDGTTKRKDTQTGMNTMLWDVTSNLPVPVEKRLSNKQKLEKSEEEVRKLRNYISGMEKSDAQQAFPQMEMAILKRNNDWCKACAVRMERAFHDYIEAKVRNENKWAIQSMKDFDAAYEELKSGRTT